MGEAVNNSADSKSELESKAPLSWRDCGGAVGGALTRPPSLERILKVRRGFFSFFQQKLG